jgi:hypothetical protein
MYEGKSSLASPRLRRKDNINLDPLETQCVVWTEFVSFRRGPRDWILLKT